MIRQKTISKICNINQQSYGRNPKTQKNEVLFFDHKRVNLQYFQKREKAPYSTALITDVLLQEIYSTALITDVLLQEI